MLLFSGAMCLESHRIRLLLAEKDIDCDIKTIGEKNVAKDLEQVNPNATIPTLHDRRITIDEPSIIMEYLEERFPYPALMPNDPVERANLRANRLQIEKTLYTPYKETIDSDLRSVRPQVKKIRQQLKQNMDLFKKQSYFMHDEMTILDCSFATLLWRLHYMKIVDLKEIKPIFNYAMRMFDRPAFRLSLTEEEAELIL